MAETKPLTTAYAPGARSLPPPAHSTPHSAHEPTHRSTIRPPARGDNPEPGHLRCRRRAYPPARGDEPKAMDTSRSKSPATTQPKGK